MDTPIRKNASATKSIVFIFAIPISLLIFSVYRGFHPLRLEFTDNVFSLMRLGKGPVQVVFYGVGVGDNVRNAVNALEANARVATISDIPYSTETGWGEYNIGIKDTGEHLCLVYDYAGTISKIQFFHSPTFKRFKCHNEENVHDRFGVPRRTEIGGNTPFATLDSGLTLYTSPDETFYYSGFSINVDVTKNLLDRTADHFEIQEVEVVQ